MAVTLPKNPINDRKLIASTIACVIVDIILEDECVPYSDRLDAVDKVRECSIEQIYNIYLGLVSGELTGDSYAGRLIQKSVNLSYGAGIFGLSNRAKKQLAFDIKRELQLI